VFFPFEELVSIRNVRDVREVRAFFFRACARWERGWIWGGDLRESEVWLDDYVESSGSDEAAGGKSGQLTWL